MNSGMFAIETPAVNVKFVVGMMIFGCSIAAMRNPVNSKYTNIHKE